MFSKTHDDRSWRVFLPVIPNYYTRGAMHQREDWYPRLRRRALPSDSPGSAFARRYGKQFISLQQSLASGHVTLLQTWVSTSKCLALGTLYRRHAFITNGDASAAKLSSKWPNFQTLRKRDYRCNFHIHKNCFLCSYAATLKSPFLSMRVAREGEKRCRRCEAKALVNIRCTFSWRRGEVRSDRSQRDAQETMLLQQHRFVGSRLFCRFPYLMPSV